MMKGDRVKFTDEVRAYTVQAISASGRYVVCTKPFAARHTVLYTVIDTIEHVRGVDNSIGNSLGYETPEECQRAAELLESGDFTLSRRRGPIPYTVEMLNKNAEVSPSEIHRRETR